MAMEVEMAMKVEMVMKEEVVIEMQLAMAMVIDLAMEEVMDLAAKKEYCFLMLVPTVNLEYGT